MDGIGARSVTAVFEVFMESIVVVRLRRGVALATERVLKKRRMFERSLAGGRSFIGGSWISNGVGRAANLICGGIVDSGDIRAQGQMRNYHICPPKHLNAPTSVSAANH